MQQTIVKYCRFGTVLSTAELKAKDYQQHSYLASMPDVQGDAHTGRW